MRWRALTSSLLFLFGFNLFDVLDLGNVGEDGIAEAGAAPRKQAEAKD